MALDKPPTITLLRMPAIWDDAPFWTSGRSVSGQLAQWGIWQSPYGMPEQLQDAVKEFAAVWNASHDQVFHTSCERLLTDIRETIERCPLVQAWQVPKGPTTVPTPGDPDCDFIDLTALARNMAHALTLSAKFDQAHNAV